MTTILPFVIYSAIPIGAVVIWLVARSVMRSEIRASNQLVERRREEWRAGGAWGRSRASIGAPSAATGEAGSQAVALAWAEEASAEEAAEAEAAAAEATDSGPRCLGRVGQAAHFEVIATDQHTSERITSYLPLNLRQVA